MDGDCEAEALAPAHLPGVDAEHRTVFVHQRAAAVAGIDGGIGLQELLIADAACGRRKHAAGDRHGQSERVSDRQYREAGAGLPAVGQRQRRDTQAALGQQDGEVEPQVHRDDPCCDRVHRRKGVHDHLGQVADHVGVGDDEPVGQRDPAGPPAAAGLHAHHRARQARLDLRGHHWANLPTICDRRSTPSGRASACCSSSSRSRSRVLSPIAKRVRISRITPL